MKKVLIYLVLAVSFLVSTNARADMLLMLTPASHFTHDETLRALATFNFWGEGRNAHDSMFRHDQDLPMMGSGMGQMGMTVTGNLSANFTNWTSPVHPDGTNTWSVIEVWGHGNVDNLRINGVAVETDWLTDRSSALDDNWSFWYLMNTTDGQTANVTFNVANTNPSWFVGVIIYEGGNHSVVPEPATLAVLGLGLAGLGVARARKNRKKA